MRFNKTRALAEQLINCRSITPNDAGCQDIIRDFLQRNCGFTITDISSNGVRNTWAQSAENKPLLVFSGHTDVVPPGPLSEWTSPPFTATVRNEKLYGRGAADMKGAIAAMLVACETFVAEHPNHRGAIGFMITSDEEGDGTDGTTKIVEYLEKNTIKIDWCVIGEASANTVLGDTVKIGRRGSLHGKLTVIGKQGHIAYPQLADNPIHRCFNALDELARVEWDQGNEFFTPTTFQIYQINADTGASNLIPGVLNASFNFRFCPASTVESLKEKVQKTLEAHELQYSIEWRLLSEPFLSKKGKLLEATQYAIKEVCGVDTQTSTTGGTSDGRFIARTGCELLEIGVVNASIHQINEHVLLDDLEKLAKIYYQILEQLLC